MVLENPAMFDSYMSAPSAQ